MVGKRGERGRKIFPAPHGPPAAGSSSPDPLSGSARDPTQRSARATSPTLPTHVEQSASLSDEMMDDSDTESDVSVADVMDTEEETQGPSTTITANMEKTAVTPRRPTTPNHLMVPTTEFTYAAAAAKGNPGTGTILPSTPPRSRSCTSGTDGHKKRKLPELFKKLPQSSASPGSKGLIEYLEEALACVKAAHSLAPHFGGTAKALHKDIIRASRLQHHPQPAKPQAVKVKEPGVNSPPPPQSSATTTSGKVTGSAEPVAAPPAVQATEASKTKKTRKRKAKGKKDASDPISKQLTLILEKGDKAPNFGPRTLRDAINAALSKAKKVTGPAVGAVARTVTGNILLTTVKPVTAVFLRQHLDVWKSVFADFKVVRTEIPEAWEKIIAHGVPAESMANVGKDFRVECLQFNNVLVKGTPRWLKPPSASKSAGSVVFSVGDTKDLTRCLKLGLMIGGTRVRAVRFTRFTPTSQCGRCQGFAHDPRKCTGKIACRICGQRHPTSTHKCETCGSSALCAHAVLKCINCKEPHMASNRDCEVLKAIRK